MNLTSYIENLFIILWNIIAFLCPIMAQQNQTSGKKLSLCAFAHIDMYFYNIFLFLKELKKKIIINKNNKADATSAQTTNKNKKQALNMFYINNQILYQLLKPLFYKRLKDAQATQNLISKHYFSRLWDKCAYFSSFSIKRISLPTFI